MAAVEEHEIRFCPRCGTSVVRKEQMGRVRPVCPACRWTFFADPKVAVAAWIEKEDQILLVRRANDPQRGLWTMPAGFLDAGEDPAAAVERECLEETGLLVRVLGLVDVVFGQEHPRGAHLVIFYRAEVLGGELLPGDDVDQAAFFSKGSLPQLAFSTTRKILGIDPI